jgi:hypothetical protein
MSRGTISDKQRREAEELHRPYTDRCAELHPHYYPGEPTSPWDQIGQYRWARQMLKTYEQRWCEHCQRWVIWTPRG